MKIETQVYGVFLKDGEKWRGPMDEFVEEEILQEFDCVDDYVKTIAREKKKKVKLLRQVWVDEEE